MTSPRDVTTFLERLDEQLDDTMIRFEEAVRRGDARAAAEIAGVPVEEIEAMMPELRRFAMLGAAEAVPVAMAPRRPSAAAAPPQRSGWSPRWVAAAAMLVVGGAGGALAARMLAEPAVDRRAAVVMRSAQLDVEGLGQGGAVCLDRFPGTVELRGSDCTVNETAAVSIVAGGRLIDQLELRGARIADRLRYAVPLSDYRADLAPPQPVTLVVSASCRPSAEEVLRLAGGGAPASTAAVVAVAQLEVVACE